MTCQPMVRAFAGITAALMFATAQAEPVTVDNCGTALAFDTAPRTHGRARHQHVRDGLCTGPAGQDGRRDRHHWLVQDHA